MKIRVNGLNSTIKTNISELGQKTKFIWMRFVGSHFKKKVTDDAKRVEWGGMDANGEEGGSVAETPEFKTEG